MRLNGVKLKSIVSMILAMLIFAWISYAADKELDLNTVKLTIGDKSYTFNKNVAGAIEDLKNDNKRITIGLSDREQRVELIISVDCKSGIIKSEQHLNTSYNKIMIMFKSSRGNFIVIPSEKMPESTKMRYVFRNESKGKYSFRKMPPGWMKMSRTQRIRTGRGIIRHREMRDKSFSIVITPIIKNGKIIEFKGAFSGLIKAGKNSFQKGQFINITNGKYRVGVMN